jgi:hypothetical protein
MTKRTNNDPQNITQKTKNRTPLKPGRVSSSCSTCDTFKHNFEFCFFLNYLPFIASCRNPKKISLVYWTEDKDTHLTSIFIDNCTRILQFWIVVSFLTVASALKQQSAGWYVAPLDTLSWFRVNQSLLLLLKAACLVEKQQLPII